MSLYAIREAAKFAVMHGFAPLGCFVAVWTYVQFAGAGSNKEKQAKNLLWTALVLMVICAFQPWYSNVAAAVAGDFNACAWDACALGFCLIAIRLRRRMSFMAAVLILVACGLIGWQATEWLRYW
ncbi:MAG: hypothetical protein JWO08_1931 [Verrucomicrobiaceae bacterium]|nr:hypothetical protein [Verrucomicrobiaceae bacterium]